MTSCVQLMDDGQGVVTASVLQDQGEADASSGGGDYTSNQGQSSGGQSMPTPSDLDDAIPF